jgi:hypothetical protein
MTVAARCHVTPQMMPKWRKRFAARRSRECWMSRIPAAIGGPMLVARLGVGSTRFLGR